MEMTNQNYEILLEWYQKGGKIVGEEQIHLTDEELAERMKLKEIYPFAGGMYPIKKKRLKVIQPLVHHVIELDKYNYYVCSRSLVLAEAPHIKYLNTDVWKVMKMAFNNLQEHGDIKCILKEDYVIGHILDILKENKVLSQDSLNNLLEGYSKS
jgi:hypothetical protein